MSQAYILSARPKQPNSGWLVATKTWTSAGLGVLSVFIFSACGDTSGQQVATGEVYSNSDANSTVDALTANGTDIEASTVDTYVQPADPIIWDDTLKDSWIEPEPGECDSAAVRAFIQYTPDGDTIHLTNGERVRLLGVSASELGDGSGECWSENAKDSLIELGPKGTEVCLLPDPNADNKDVYDRLLRYVFVPHIEDGRWVLANARQVRIGYARAYTSFLWGLRYRNEIIAAEFEARTEDIGGWDACGWQPR